MVTNRIRFTVICDPLSKNKVIDIMNERKVNYHHADGMSILTEYL